MPLRGLIVVSRVLLSGAMFAVACLFCVWCVCVLD